MEQTLLYNTDLHFEHKLWNSTLNFYLDELKIFNHRLEELVVRYEDPDILRSLEHFQNEFILHQARIEDLKETIEAHEIRITGQSYNKKESMDRILVRSHLETRKKVEQEMAIYSDLKKAFFAFLTEHY